MRQRIWIPEAPLLNFRRYREIEHLHSNVRVEGWFELELVHARSQIVTRRVRFRNLIVNAGMDALGTSRALDLMSYCAVGTGNTAPAVTDIALEVELARTNSDGGFPDTKGTAAGNEYAWFKRTRSFTTAQANGNLTEVGMFRLSAGAPMFCRQLLKDELGNPTTITKTSEFELRVIYEYRVYPNLADVIYSAVVNGAPMDVTARPALIGFHWDAATDFPGGATLNNVFDATTYAGAAAALGAVTARPNGTESAVAAFGDLVLAAYVNGSFSRDATITWVSSKSNYPDVKAFMPGGRCHPHQHLLAAPIAKTNTQKLVLNVRQSWARA